MKAAYPKSHRTIHYLCLIFLVLSVSQALTSQMIELQCDHLVFAGRLSDYRPFNKTNALFVQNREIR